MFDLLTDLWSFMRVRKKFWLGPIILVMLLLGALIVFAHGSSTHCSNSHGLVTSLASRRAMSPILDFSVRNRRMT